MPDISHQWGSDLTIGPAGDLAVSDNTELCKQRVLRRLLTNTIDYIWQPAYGAGLAGFIGQPGNVGRIRAVIRSQIFKEAAVARTPEPMIDVVVSPEGNPSTVYVHIRYADAISSQTQILSFSVGT